MCKFYPTLAPPTLPQKEMSFDTLESRLKCHHLAIPFFTTCTWQLCITHASGIGNVAIRKRGCKRHFRKAFQWLDVTSENMAAEDIKVTKPWKRNAWLRAGEMCILISQWFNSLEKSKTDRVDQIKGGGANQTYSAYWKRVFANMFWDKYTFLQLTGRCGETVLFRRVDYVHVYNSTLVLNAHLTPITSWDVTHVTVFGLNIRKMLKAQAAVF